MYSVLIVDDESMIRRGLSRIIHWEELGFEVAGAVGDAYEAIQIMQETKVDVLLTDISMPEMSGLELIRQARNMWPGIRTVVISGYSEFDYAREAIELKVESYILKPLDPVKISGLFDNLRKSLDHEQKNELKEQYLQSEYEWLRKFEVKERRVQKDYRFRLITLLEEGRQLELDGFVKEIFDSMSGMGADFLKDYCIDTLQSISQYFYLEDPLPFKMVQMKDEKETKKDGEDLAVIQKNFLEDLKLMGSYVGSRSESFTALISGQARQYIEEHYQDSCLSLKQVADKLGVSYGYLSTAFSRNYGETFKSYLMSVRVEAARKLLLERRYKIYEIADMVGYGSSRYFTYSFKKRFGLSPADYLSRMSGNGGGR